MPPCRDWRRRGGARSKASLMHGVMSVIRAVERWTLTALLIGMSLGYASQVVIREVAPEIATRTSWIEELTVFAMVWLAFLGLGLTLERGRHVAMGSFVEKLPPAARKWASRAVDLVGFAFAAYLAKLGWDITVFVRDSGRSARCSTSRWRGSTACCRPASACSRCAT
ncbi:MAG: TRAP transporter small permease [Burkholderiales bacterium]|nr:TRAP transporter small permease [Burkholderiales bacterium]